MSVAIKTGPFATGSVRYLEAGWQGVIPLPAGCKSPPPPGRTGRDGEVPSESQVRKWAFSASTSDNNLALVLPRGVIGIDVDSYKAEGAASWDALVNELSELPDTWRSSARPAPAGIRLFAVPPDVELAGAPRPGIEIIQHHHRYLCTWPSIHPEGSRYEWHRPDGTVADGPPRPEELPPLPVDWILALLQPPAPDHDKPQPSLEDLLAGPPTAPAPTGGWMDQTVAAFNQATSWVDILEPLGWTFHHRQGAIEHWTRPGKDGRLGHSATINANGTDRLINHSGSVTELEGSPTSHDRFSVWAAYHHAGDRQAAALAARSAGHGPALEQRAVVDEEALTVLAGATPAHSERIPTAAPTPELRLFATAGSQDLLDDDEPLRWLLRGLVVDPTYGQIAGEMKTLKTYVSTFLAIGLATGTTVFDQFTIDQARPVLMYVGEGGRLPHRRRIRRIARAMGVNLEDLADQLHRSYDVAAVTSLEYQRSLERDLDTIRPGLFLLDPLYAFHGNGDGANNLHLEGAHLNNAVHQARQADVTSLIVNHFNQTGGGTNLKRITQAGSGEWVDSWILLHHREEPDVNEGHFKLGLHVGSRQWGGNEWALDLNIGSLDPETGEHDGDITWELRRGTGAADNPHGRILATAAANPDGLTREQLAKSAGTNIEKARRLVDHLEAKGHLTKQLVSGLNKAGRKQTKWVLVPAASPPVDDLQDLLA